MKKRVTKNVARIRKSEECGVDEEIICLAFSTVVITLLEKKTL